MITTGSDASQLVSWMLDQTGVRGICRPACCLELSFIGGISDQSLLSGRVLCPAGGGRFLWGLLDLQQCLGALYMWVKSKPSSHGHEVIETMHYICQQF